MATRLAWLQPRDGWAALSDVGAAPPPVRSKWPTVALPTPSALLVQLLQVAVVGVAVGHRAVLLAAGQDVVLCSACRHGR